MSTVEPSFQELAALAAELTALVVELTAELEQRDLLLGQKDLLLEVANAQIALLEVDLEAARAKLGKNSKNSSTPESKESIQAKAKRKAERKAAKAAEQDDEQKAEQKAERKPVKSQRVRSKDRTRGGQPGHQGAGLTPTRNPDETFQIYPAECSSCGECLAGATEAGSSWAQVLDLPEILLKTVHYVLMRLRCGGCGKLTMEVPAGAQAGAVVYGPGVNTAAILLGSKGNVPVELTAGLMDELLRARVSTGFVAQAHKRLAELLAKAGFDEAMTAALRAEPVLCGDETSVNVVKNIDKEGEEATGSPHVVVVRTPDERLVWYREITARSAVEIAGLGVFDGWGGVLVRDDYAGWHQFDASLRGVQQCVQHLIRHLQGVLDLGPEVQQWAAQVMKALRDAGRLVAHAVSAGIPVDVKALADARKRYDQGVAVGYSVNLSRPWPGKGNHPGLVLARRLKAKVDEVWLFTDDLAVPWTNNASERSLKSPKLHQKVSGYWQTTKTLARFCRVRSYLVSARNHGISAKDAIHAALAGNPWLPTPKPAPI